jgi:hypothetical protein
MPDKRVAASPEDIRLSTAWVGWKTAVVDSAQSIENGIVAGRN